MPAPPLPHHNIGRSRGDRSTPPGLNRQLRGLLDELNQTVDYVLTDNPTPARSLFETIRTHVTLLAEQPGLGRPGRVPGTRELVIARTPYVVAYTVDPATQTVVILRVLRGARQWPQAFD